MSVPKHPCGPSVGAGLAAGILDRHHVYVKGPRGECLECELQKKLRADAEADRIEMADRRRRFLAGCIWFGLAALIAALWIAGKLS